MGHGIVLKGIVKYYGRGKNIPHTFGHTGVGSTCIIWISSDGLRHGYWGPICFDLGLRIMYLHETSRSYLSESFDIPSWAGVWDMSWLWDLGLAYGKPAL
jgi:hypothetical protein